MSQKKSSGSAVFVMTRCGILAAMAVILYYIEIPVVAFYKLDLSTLPAILAGFAMGPLQGVAVVVIKNLVHMLGTSTACVGEMADIITPNRTEARLLLGDAPDDEAVSNEELLAGLHNENVIITSVRRGDKIGYLARLGTEIVRIEKPMVHRQLHGTGDVFTSALCGEVLSGGNIKNALLAAADFCDRSIQDTAKYQPAHWYGLCFEEELSKRRCSLK